MSEVPPGPAPLGLSVPPSLSRPPHPHPHPHPSPVAGLAAQGANAATEHLLALKGREAHGHGNTYRTMISGST